MSLLLPLTNLFRRKVGITELRRWFGRCNRDDMRDTHIAAFFQRPVGSVLFYEVIFRQAVKRLHQFGDLIKPTLIRPTRRPLIALIRAIRPAHGGAAALVPPITVSVRSIRTS
jgi:hypothetical protein